LKYYLKEKGVKSIDRICTRHIICLVAIIALAGTIRFWNLGKLPLLGDEAYHFLASSAIHEHGIRIII
jgi:predicted membrane-bound mannosyltransferase